VTNSSSSSFLICKKNLLDDQIEAIRQHSELGERMGLLYAEEAWNIEENDLFITGYTSMDNFDFFEFLEKIEVNLKAVSRSEYPFSLPSDTMVEKPIQKNSVHEKTWRDYLEDIRNGVPCRKSGDDLEDLIDGMEDW
jgi:hypothetical protein